MELRFTIPGEPRGKGRPRIGKVGPHARMFTDAKTRSYEGLIALAAETALANRPMLDVSLEVNVRVRICPAQSISKKKRLLMLEGHAVPTKKPDLDNVVKAVLDGCNAVAFRDDALVVKINAFKIYHERPGVDVIIRPFPTRPLAKLDILT